MALVYVNGFDELSDPEPYWLDTTGTAFRAGTPGRFGAGLRPGPPNQAGLSCPGPGPVPGPAVTWL